MVYVATFLKILFHTLDYCHFAHFSVYNKHIRLLLLSNILFVRQSKWCNMQPQPKQATDICPSPIQHKPSPRTSWPQDKVKLCAWRRLHCSLGRCVPCNWGFQGRSSFKVAHTGKMHALVWRKAVCSFTAGTSHSPRVVAYLRDADSRNTRCISFNAITL